MTVNYQTIVQQLPSLSLIELQEIVDRVKALKSLPGGQAAATAVPINGDAMGALRAVCEVLADQGIEYTPAFMLARSQEMGAFANKVGHVHAYFERSQLSRNAQGLVFKIAVGLLYQNMVEIGLPVSARNVMRQIHRVPAVLNRAFPGYAARGMLSWIARGRTQGV